MVTWQPGVTLEKMEQQVIENAMVFYRQNKTHAAEGLGIAIRTLDSKLEQYASDRANKPKPKPPVTQADVKNLLKPCGVDGANTVSPFTGKKASGTISGAQKVEYVNPLAPKGLLDCNPPSPFKRPDAQAGVSVESADELSEKQSVSMQERKKVQKVLSR